MDLFTRNIFGQQQNQFRGPFDNITTTGQFGLTGPDYQTIFPHVFSETYTSPFNIPNSSNGIKVNPRIEAARKILEKKSDVKVFSAEDDDETSKSDIIKMNGDSIENYIIYIEGYKHYKCDLCLYKTHQKKDIMDHLCRKKHIYNFKNNSVQELEPIKVPIKKKVKKEKIPATLKNILWHKYFETSLTGICQCCKVESISKAIFDAGHIISEKNGGKVVLDNLKPICKLCNSSMGRTNMDDFMKKYGI